jgi:HSP20 family protein
MTWSKRLPLPNMFDDIFSEMTEFSEIFNRIFDEDQKNLGLPGVYYYSIQVSSSPDGKPVIREFSNSHPSKRKQVEHDVRKPLVDVSIDENEKILKIVAEMPGASKENIKLNAKETHLSISTTRADKPYNAEVPLPQKVDPDTAEASYNNGILEVVFQLKGRDEHNGIDIRIK